MMAAVIDIEHEIVREMTPEAARDLTDRIKASTTELAEMLFQAHQGQAWQALGYGSWKEYIAAEFQMSERHSFRLLDFVEIKRDLPTDQLVSSESQVRPLKGLPRAERGKAWEKAVEIAGGEQPTAKQVQEAVVETQGAGTYPPASVSTAMVKAKQAVGILADIPLDDLFFGDAMLFTSRWLAHRSPVATTRQIKTQLDAEKEVTNIVLGVIKPILGPRFRKHITPDARQKISDSVAELLTLWVATATLVEGKK